MAQSFKATSDGYIPCESHLKRRLASGRVLLCYKKLPSLERATTLLRSVRPSARSPPWSRGRSVVAPPPACSPVVNPSSRSLFAVAVTAMRTFQIALLFFSDEEGNCQLTDGHGRGRRRRQTISIFSVSLKGPSRASPALSPVDRARACLSLPPAPWLLTRPRRPSSTSSSSSAAAA